MRTFFVVGLAILMAAEASAPSAAQVPPGKTKTPTSISPKTSNPPAPVNAPPSANYPTEVASKSIDAWIKEIENTDPSVRDHAIKMVIAFGPNARKAIPAIVNQIRPTNDFGPHGAAILALGEIMPLLNVEADKPLPKDIKDAISALTTSLGDSTQGIIRWRAALALAQIGPAARTAVPKLNQRTTDNLSFEIREAACRALGRVGIDESGFAMMQALNPLVLATKDPCREVRIEALQSIIMLGPPQSGDISAFKNLLEQRKSDKDKSVTVWVRVALMRLDGTTVNEANISAIVKVMKDSGDADTRAQAARALGFIGPAGKAAIPDLIDVLKSDEPLLVVQAAWALLRMGNVAENAIPSLETVVSNHKNEDVKAIAKAAIEEIKKKK